jgi:hypothetical protein
MRTFWVIVVGLLFVAALASGLAWLFAGDMVYVPRLQDSDPAVVTAAYFDAQRWALDSVAQDAEAPSIAVLRQAADPAAPLPDDVRFAQGIAVGEPEVLTAASGYLESVRFLVTYTSRVEGASGQRPGIRMWWVTLGLDEGGRWRVTSLMPAQ